MTSGRARRAHAASGVSWLALLAAATLGGGQASSVRAEVSVGDALAGDEGEGFRLVVQSYEPGAVGADEMPSEFARPLGSTQRAVTPEELRQGVRVDIVHLGRAEAAVRAPVVVAWVERGQPDLEFDALCARPAPGACLGTGTLGGSDESASARVVLSRRTNLAA